MTVRTATERCGVLLVFGVAAVLSRGGVAAYQQKPAKPLPYVTAWNAQFTTRDAPKIAIGPASVALAFPRDPLQVRSVKTGDLMWSAPLMSTRAPAIGDGLVFVVSGDHLHALDELTGQSRWDVDLGQAGLAPTWRPGWLLVPVGREVRAYRSTDGSLGWQTDTGHVVTEPVIIDGNLVLAATDGPALAALDGVGSLRWRVSLDARPGPLAAGDGFVYFGAADRSVRAYRQNDGEFAWAFDHMEVVGAPAAAPRLVCVALFTNEIRGLDSHVGNLRQRRPLAGRPAAGPTLAGTDVLVPLNSGDFVVLDASDLKERARIPSPAPRDTFESAVVAADGGRIYSVLVAVSGERTLTAFERRAVPASR